MKVTVGVSSMTLCGLLKHMARALVARALADGGLDQLGRYQSPDGGGSPSPRRLLIDLIEQYARHAGHADLIRESVDGLVGESPPG